MADNTDMMRQIFTLLESNVFFGDRLSTGQFVALVSPGQFISTNLKPNSLNDQRTIWKLTNSTMAASFLWKPTISTVSQLYEEILRFRALPHDPLTPTQQQQLKAIRQQLAQWEFEYEKYRLNWEEADIALSKAIANEASEPELVELQRARARAQRQWERYGYKYDFERLRGDEWDLVAADPNAMWQEFVDRFDAGKRVAPSGDYYLTNLIPHPSDWSKASWAKQTLNTKDVFQHEYSRSTHFDAGASGGWGLWSFGGSYSKDTQYKHENSSTTEMNIAFEYLVVTIDRTWMTEDILARRFWCWKKNVHDNLMLSDGGNVNTDPPVAPTGVMPLIPTHFFIVRNVKLTGNWSKEDMTFYHEKVVASIGGGWGPFQAHGSYSEETTERTYTGAFSGASLVIEQPQLIAVAGTLIGRQPNPDIRLKWGVDANLDPPQYPPALGEQIERLKSHASEFEEDQFRRQKMEEIEKVIVARRK